MEFFLFIFFIIALWKYTWSAVVSVGIWVILYSIYQGIIWIQDWWFMWRHRHGNQSLFTKEGWTTDWLEKK